METKSKVDLSVPAILVTGVVLWCVLPRMIKINNLEQRQKELKVHIEALETELREFKEKDLEQIINKIQIDKEIESASDTSRDNSKDSQDTLDRLEKLANDKDYKFVIPSNVKETYDRVIQGLPESFKQLMKEHNIKIGCHGNMKGINGVYFHKPKAVFVRNDKNFAYALRHELGHFLDYTILQKTVGSDKLDEIFEEEKYNYEGHNRGYTLRNSGEYFAEYFSEYFVNTKSLKDNNPKTYKVIDDALKNL